LRKGYKLHEAEDHFEVDHDDGKGPFKVAKHGLDKGTMDKIRNFARGGAVEQGTDRTDMENTGATHMGRMKEMHRMPEMKRVGPARHFAKGGYSPEDTFKENVGVPLSNLKENVGMIGTLLNPSEALKGTSLNDPLRGPENVMSGENFAKKKASGEYYEAEPGVYHRKGDVVPQFGAAPSIAPTGDQSVQQGVSGAGLLERPPETEEKVKPLVVPGGVGAGGSLRGLEAGVKEEKAGFSAQAEVEKAVHDERALSLQTHQQAMTDSAAKHEARRVANEADIAQMRQDIKDTKIDPSNLWHSMSGWKKAQSALALFLGGAAQGLTGRGNPAMEMMDRAIQNDIAAQKSNLGKKQTALENLMRQGHSINEAEQMEAARLKSTLAGAAELAGERHGGEKAKALALQLSGQLDQKSAMERDHVLTSAASRDHMAIQNSLAREQFKWGQEDRVRQQKMLQDLGASGLSPSEAQGLQQIFSSGKLPEHQVGVQDEYLVGRDPTTGAPKYQMQTTTAVARNPKAAEKFADAALKTRDQQDKMRKLEDFRAAHPQGTLTPAANAEGKALATDFVLSFIPGQEGLNRVNQLELDRVDKMVKDPTAIYGAVSGGTAGSYKALKSMLESRKEAIEDQYLFPDPSRRARRAQEMQRRRSLGFE